MKQLGATVLSPTETQFRVWAPRHWKVLVEILDADGTRRHPLQRDGDGYYHGVVSNVGPGALYRYVLDDGGAYPDPASRRQPEGVHGPSEVVDANAYAWADDQWQGVSKRELIIYELHVGAFTEPGTFRAAIGRLPELVELGVTAVELLPVVQTPGKWNWGYDGVNLFAVRETYGQPDDLKAFVDACHAHGLAVLLDVVYNHLGPEGNYLGKFGPYSSSKHNTPWGDALNFDGRRSKAVRNFVVENARYWLEEYHFDGLRLDAVHFIYDDSPVTILDDVRRAVDQLASETGRTLHLVGETNVHDAALITPDNGQALFDAIWSDCLMHSLYSLAAPELRLAHREYHGATDVTNVLQHGYLYHGPDYQRVQSGSHPPASTTKDGRPVLESFITGLQTHDSVGNHPHGRRLHQVASKDFQKAAATLTLLHPSLPLLFMGEEHAIDRPFHFFADFENKRLRKAVDWGRAKEYPEHEWTDALRPSAPEAFHNSNCSDAADGDPEMWAWYKQLITLRKEGLQGGWLAADRFEVSYHERSHVYSMQFSGENRRRICVLACLIDATSEPPTEAFPLPTGRVLTATHADLTAGNNQPRLTANQAVVLELET